ncbi:MAG: hypothetical protein ABI443_05400 [Chthoniobacterales bacterium]
MKLFLCRSSGSFALLLTALLAIGTAHAQLYVAFDNGNEGVIRTYSTSGSSLNSPFISVNAPYGITYNSGSLYVGTLGSSPTVPTGNSINEYNATTGTAIYAPLQSYGASVIDVAIYGGHVYAAYYGISHVGEYSATTPQTVVSHSIIAAGVSNDRGIAFGSSGTLYVSSYTNGTVGTYTSTGSPLNTTFLSGIVNPWGIAVDAAGNVYVASDMPGTAGSIGRYDATTHVFNAGFITNLNRPLYLALDGQGNLYASMFGNTSNNGSIGKFDATTGIGNSQFIPGLNAPTGIALDLSAIPEPSAADLVFIGGIAYALWRARENVRKKLK